MAETILVVDDNEAMRHAVSRLMTHAGYSVIQAATGQETLEKAEKNPPDLVLLDVHLPDLDGIEVLKRLKANPVTRDCFVVHLSAERVDVESKAVGLEQGADGYLSQPIDNRELVARVRAFVRHKRTIEDLRASEARYRHLFESNPQPMWIVTRNGQRFLAVNDSASKHYGYTQREFLKKSPKELIAEEHSADHAVSPVTAFDLRQRHRRKDGSVIDVEMSQHDLQWKDEDASVLQIVDVTAWLQVERERLQLIQRYERELKGLEQISHARQKKRPRKVLKGASASTPDVFAALQEDYKQLIEQALEQRIYKVEHDVSAGLRSMADRLFEINASPRDVIDLHCAALRSLVPEPAHTKAQGYVEIGRLAIVELMGYLVSAYRDFALGQTAERA